MNKIELIKQCIEKAERKESKLEEQVLSIGGFTGEKIRHLLNNLGGISTNVYEIGNHRGSTFCSAIYKNDNLGTIISCDNFTEFNDDNPRQEFFENVKNSKPTQTDWLHLDDDCFTLTELPVLPDLYCYDGLHADWAQKKALTYYYDMLPNEFIFTCDDYQWEFVKRGTQEGITECGFEVLFEAELGMNTPSSAPNYWNGFYVTYLKKK